MNAAKTGAAHRGNAQGRARGHYLSLWASDSDLLKLLAYQNRTGARTRSAAIRQAILQAAESTPERRGRKPRSAQAQAT